KFALDVLASLDDSITCDPLEALDKLSEITSTAIPAPLSGLDKREVRFKKTIDKEDMLDEISGELGIK
ncbi:MAG: threonine synthase, partial [Clostridia bacterium]|nr:threonine synthase [Clostridia bacterium]